MASREFKATRDHDEIRRWAEAAGGEPVALPARGGNYDPPIDLALFGVPVDPAARRITWAHFFREFDRRNLWFMYEKRTNGHMSTSFDIVDGETADGVATHVQQPSAL